MARPIRLIRASCSSALTRGHVRHPSRNQIKAKHAFAQNHLRALSHQKKRSDPAVSEGQGHTRATRRNGTPPTSVQQVASKSSSRCMTTASVVHLDETREASAFAGSKSAPCVLLRCASCHVLLLHLHPSHSQAAPNNKRPVISSRVRHVCSAAVVDSDSSPVSLCLACCNREGDSSLLWKKAEN